MSRTKLVQMNSDAYQEWTELFDSNVVDVWKVERKELQRTVMLLWTLQKELKSVHENLETEVSRLRQQLSTIDYLERKTKSSPNSGKKKSPNSENKENRVSLSLLETRTATYASNITELESPDLFRNNDPNCDSKPDNKHEPSPSMIIDLSISDDDKKEIDTSPTLISKRRKDPRRYKSILQDDTSEINKCGNIDLVKKNIFQTPRSDLEMSVIDSTPDLRGAKLKTNSKVSEFVSKKKHSKKIRNLTLTQIYPNSLKIKLNDEKKFDVGEDSDETYFEANKSNSKMGITDLLSFINKDESNKDCTFSDMGEMDSSQEIDQFSKGALFDESAYLEEASPQKKLKMAVLPEPVVRGHARKNLNGFACENCRNFYDHMNLSPKKLQERMDKCSKHRYKYQPRADTPPGLWDLTIAPRE